MKHEQIIYGTPPSKSNQYRIITIKGHGSLAKTDAMKKYERSMKKVTDEVLIESYSVWRTGEEVGICGQSVYERLKKLGVVKRMNLWTVDDDAVLLREYKRYKDENRLDDLAAKLGRTKQFMCRKARVLGSDRHYYS